MSATREVALSINCGSSSLKVASFTFDGDEPHRVATAGVDRIGGDGLAWVKTSGPRTEQAGTYADHASALQAVSSLLEKAGVPAATLVGHRIVHGGARHVEPERIDAKLVADLKEVISFAPLHMGPALKGIEAVAKHYPDVPQVACFDTAFHASMPEVARRLPLPDRFDREGVRRYGFHGLSYEYIVSTLAPVPPRVVIAHLGSGASLVAVKDGKAVDTTMGFTPAGGVVMATRTGDLDPGVLLYLLRKERLAVDALETLVEREAGLSAIGGTSDMKALLARVDTDPRAKLATSMFAYSVRKAVGALAAVLGGVDLLVFTGGIGEHAAEVRRDVCEGLGFLGIRLDAARNARGEGAIGAEGNTCEVRVIPTDEERVVAKHARRIVAEASPEERA